jgi:hypothetical protein
VVGRSRRRGHTDGASWMNLMVGSRVVMMMVVVVAIEWRVGRAGSERRGRGGRGHGLLHYRRQMVGRTERAAFQLRRLPFALAPLRAPILEPYL